MNGHRDAAQNASDATALTVTGAAAVVFLLTAHNLVPVRELSAARDRAIELTVQMAPPATIPAPPPSVPRAEHRSKPILAPLPSPVPVPVVDEPAPLDAALVAAATPAAAPSSETHPDLDAQYAAELRANIDRRTRPPESAQYRLRHPAGEVRVRFVVTRSGEPKDVALLRSSGSALLDEAALHIVAAGRYASMPAKAFAGETTHTFVVTIEFRPPSLALHPSVATTSVAA